MSDGPNILVVGSVNMDLVVRAEHMPTPGETVLGKDFAAHPGGKGANQAVAAARLDANVTFLGRVGDDAFGKDLRQNLLRENVNVEHLIVTSTAPSGVAMILVDGIGENSIVVASGANFMLTPDDVYSREEIFQAADLVLLQLEVPLPTIRASIDLANRHGCTTVLDPAPARANLPDVLFAVDIISPNVSEAELLTGRRANEDRVDKLIAAELINRGAKRAVLKLGDRGSMVFCTDGHIYRIPPYKVDVVDTTAAGDVFTAALGVRVARGDSMQDAARYANAAGALACSQFGAQQAAPTALEVQMLMRDQA